MGNLCWRPDNLKIDTNKDRISDAESKDTEDKSELLGLNEQLEIAASALEEFIQTLNSAETDLENSKLSLEEAKSEELAVQEIMESSGDESAKFSQQLTKLLSELALANETLNAAQTEVNRTAAQAAITASCTLTDTTTHEKMEKTCSGTDNATEKQLWIMPQHCELEEEE